MPDAMKPCDGKRQFDTKDQAERRLAEIRNARVRTMQVPRYSFACPHCGKFHLSSKPRRQDVDLVLQALGMGSMH